MRLQFTSFGFVMRIFSRLVNARVRCLMSIGLFLTVNQLQARLGESLAEVDAGYGKAITVEKGRTDRESKQLYSHDGYRITVVFLNGKSSCEEFTKEDLRNIAFSDDETRAVLMANCLGLQWNRLRSTDNEPMWEKNWELGNGGKIVGVASSKYPYSTLAVVTTEYVHYNSNFEKMPKEKAEPTNPD